jgi:DNA (cytosine-5)-methyltransferase 1
VHSKDIGPPLVAGEELSNKMVKKHLTFASLFSGCGGFDLGFQQEGFVCVGAFDNDHVAVTNYIRNLNSGATLCDLKSGCIDAPAVQSVDLLIAGAPCQGFSTAGKRRLDDPRNALLLAAGRIALKIKPRVFVAENVSGILAQPHKQYWKQLDTMLSAAGYTTKTLKLRAHTLGMGQVRTRILLVASRITHMNGNLTIPETPPKTLREVLEGVEKCSDHNPRLLPKGSQLDVIAGHIRPGQKLCNVRSGPRSVHTWDIPEVFGKITQYERRVLDAILNLRRRERVRRVGDADPVLVSSIDDFIGGQATPQLSTLVGKGYLRKVGHRFDLTKTFNGKFRRLSWEQPSLTVDTRFGSPRYFLHPDENRGLTVREAARIQGFPDDYSFEGTDAQKYRMIGNAVPPPMAAALARAISCLIHG